MPCPFKAVPSAHEDKCSYVLVEHEGKPHADESPTEDDAEEIAKEDTYTPLHYQSEDKWEMYVARGTEGIGRIDVDGFARLEQTVNPEHRAAESNDGLVGGEHREYLVAETSTDN